MAFLRVSLALPSVLDARYSTVRSEQEKDLFKQLMPEGIDFKRYDKIEVPRRIHGSKPVKRFLRCLRAFQFCFLGRFG